MCIYERGRKIAVKKERLGYMSREILQSHNDSITDSGLVSATVFYSEVVET